MFLLSGLKIMEQTSNGFEISDEDLKLRGPGEFFGTKQHGFVRSRLANFVEDGPIIRHARNIAFQIVSSDMELCERILEIDPSFPKN